MKYLGENYLEYSKSFIELLKDEIASLNFSNDSENIHKARTSIRKLRGIIKLFSISKKLDRDLKNLADSFTYLRDLEVQLDFLSNFPQVVEIRREKLLLWEMEKSRLIKELPEFHSYATSEIFCSKLRGKTLSSVETFQKFFKALYSLVSALGRVSDENNSLEALHHFRISLKKTVYLLEAVSLENKLFSPFISQLKEFQDLLGSIHDLQLLKESLENDSREKKIGQEKEFLLSKIDKRTFSKLDLLQEKIILIPEIIKNIVCQLKADSLKDFPSEEYKISLLNDRDIDFLWTDPDQHLHSAEILSNRFSPDRQHVRRVMEKSQSIMEELDPIYKFTGEEKFLLHMAALLHDTGHFFREENHNIGSRNIICRSRYLELDFISKIKIGWIVERHKGKSEQDSELSIFSKKEKKHLKILAGILRAADGMELESTEYMRDYSIQLKKGELYFTCEKISDALKKRFRSKSEFLKKETEFNISLVIS